ncbi:MAG: hypothetical protein DMG60_11325 [Acidobacteria bacterium]|nr:MAG: hypothetical protein DMG60_11325 [Acidobacteriota bacterium]
MRVFHCDVHAIDLPAGHQFPAGKYKLIRERLMCDGFTLQLASLAPVELVKLVHSESYVNDFLSGSLSPAAVRRIGFPWSEGLVRRTRTSVGGTLAAVEDAFERGWGANLAGGTHHAFADGGAGYCVFNDLAIAIQWLRRDGRIRRAAVIDLDVHQGESGVDALYSDRLGHLALTHAGLSERDRRVMLAARSHDIPFVITLGGGYSLPMELTAEAHANVYRTASDVFN